jgi:hypothetical protein
LGVYKVQGTTKEEFLQYNSCRNATSPLYSARHATRVAKLGTIYQTKHDIVDSDMV